MDPKRIVQEGYDSLGGRFRDWNSGSDETRSWFMDEILQRLPAGADVLELGCGWGPAAAILGDGRVYTGVDLSSEQLAIARARLPEMTFVHADFTQLELPEGSLDAVVAFYVFNHVPQAEQAPAFERIFGWLRPGGRLMLSLGASDTADEVEDDWLGVPMFFAGFEPDVNERSLLNAGFELELSETRSQFEEGEGEATFHWVIARKPTG